MQNRLKHYSTYCVSFYVHLYATDYVLQDEISKLFKICLVSGAMSPSPTRRPFSVSFHQL